MLGVLRVKFFLFGIRVNITWLLQEQWRWTIPQMQQHTPALRLDSGLLFRARGRPYCILKCPLALGHCCQLLAAIGEAQELTTRSNPKY